MGKLPENVQQVRRVKLYFFNDDVSLEHSYFYCSNTYSLIRGPGGARFHHFRPPTLNLASESTFHMVSSSGIHGLLPLLSQFSSGYFIYSQSDFKFIHYSAYTLLKAILFSSIFLKIFD